MDGIIGLKLWIILSIDYFLMNKSEIIISYIMKIILLLLLLF